MDQRRIKAFPTGVRQVRDGLEIYFNWPKGSGKRIYKKLGKGCSPAAVKRAGILRQQIKDAINHGVFRWEDFFPDDHRVHKIQIENFAHYAQAYLNNPENQWDKSSRDKFKSSLERIWMPRLHDKPINTITYTDIIDVLSAYIQWFIEKYAKEPAISTYNDWFIGVRGTFEMAVKDRVIKPKDNPMDTIRNKKRIIEETDPFEIDEADAIIEDIYQHEGDMWGAWFELGFYSGLRYPSEPSALTWEKVNLRKSTHAPLGSILVNQIRTRSGIKRSTKTHHARTLLLNSRSLHAIELAKKITGSQNSWIFLQADRWEKDKFNPVNTADPQRIMFDASQRRLGIRHRDMYAMRHTYASFGLTHGANPAFLASQLGHSLEEFFKTYAKWIGQQDASKQMLIIEEGIRK